MTGNWAEAKASGYSAGLRYSQAMPTCRPFEQPIARKYSPLPISVPTFIRIVVNDIKSNNESF